MVYDRDGVVRCITRHYELLLRLAHLEPGDIQYPPPAGWDDEQLVVDVLRYYGRSAEVVDLLRHLPYVKPARSPAPRYVHLETRSLSYLRGQGLFAGPEPGARGKTAEDFRGRRMVDLALMPDDGEYPPSVVALSFTDGTVGTCWLLDTEGEGLFYPVEEPHRPALKETAAGEDRPRLGVFRPHDLQKYFDLLFFEYESLVWVPVYGPWGWEVAYGAWPEAQAAQRLLREHGWPDAFRRDEYKEAIMSMPR